MRFLHGRELSNTIRDVVANERMDAAVAFWGKDAFDLLGLDKLKPRSRVICDAFSGACNPYALRRLLEADIEVYDLSGLHAKVYLCGPAVVVGSANASANGLGQEGLELDLGLEAAVVTTDPEVRGKAQEWFDGQVKKAHRLHTGQLTEIEQLWLKRRSGRPTRQTRTLEEAILSQDQSLKDRRFFVILYKPEELPEPVERRFKETPFHRADAYDPDDIPFFWDAQEWALEPGDLLLSFEVGSNGVRFDGMSTVQGLVDKGSIVPVKPEKRPMKLRFSKAQGAALAEHVAELVHDGRLEAPSPLIPIYDFAEMVGTNA